MKAPLSGATYTPVVEVNKICLVDADFLKYTITGKISKFLEEKHNAPEHEKMYSVQKYVMDALKVLEKKFKCAGFIYCFSDSSSNTFRYAAAMEKEYKGNRKDKVPENYYEDMFSDMTEVISHVSKLYPVAMVDGLEADDVLSVLQNEHTFIYSYDKDMDQVPGTHYDISRSELYEVSKEDGLLSLMTQMITGDTVDNIPGIPGMGSKKAEIFIRDIPNVKQLPKAILTLYMRKYGIMDGVDFFCENWYLLKLRTTRGNYFRTLIQDALAIRNTLIEEYVESEEKEN